jgi:hypothetical protein
MAFPTELGDDYMLNAADHIPHPFKNVELSPQLQVTPAAQHLPGCLPQQPIAERKALDLWGFCYEASFQTLSDRVPAYSQVTPKSPFDGTKI